MRNVRLFLRPARFLLSSLFLVAFLSAASVSAQSTADVCRETEKVLKQLEREADDLSRIEHIKRDEEMYRNRLSALNKAITSGDLIRMDDLTELTRTLKAEVPTDSTGQPKTAAQLTPAERSSLQRTVRSALQQALGEAVNNTWDQLNDRINKLSDQIESRKRRLKDLNCKQVLEDGTGKGEDDPPSSNNAACWNGTFKGNDTGGYAMTINLSQGSGGEVTGGWSFYHKGAGKQVNATINTATAGGNTLTGSWTQTGVQMSGNFQWQWLPGKTCREFDGSFQGTKYWTRMVKQ